MKALTVQEILRKLEDMPLSYEVIVIVTDIEMDDGKIGYIQHVEQDDDKKEVWLY